MAQASSIEELQLNLSGPDTTIFLGFFVDSSSVKVSSGEEPLTKSWWDFSPDRGEINISIPDTQFTAFSDLTVTYRAPVFTVSRTLRLREFEERADTFRVDSNTVAERIRRPVRDSDDLFGEANLNQNGSLSRGFTVGNRQDLALDSGLRLDLNGNITDDISIQASLTDRSTPIQPDGATQNIREFDRVYIQLEAPLGNLELGDVDITYNESRFARINRRVQGAVGEGDTPFGRFGGGASVARGTFRTQSFSGIEGVQGPYRLSGAENENFIIVIAGSETVYVDGSPVTRGAENEYIIDYGLGEITFTNNFVVTDETRIVVEFQYITQAFTRTLFTAKGRDEGLLGGRLNVGATYIREADNKNPETQLSLTEEDIEKLRNLGGDVDDLFVSGVDSVGFREDADFILYAKTDTTLNGESFEIFQNLPGNLRSVFRVRFTNVGDANGSYRRVGGAVNGILYEWVGPGRGRYEPIVKLQAPQSHQMLALDSKLKLNQYLSLNAEWAVSEFERNRFSETGSSNEIDFAVNGSLNLTSIETGIGTVTGGIEHTRIGDSFEFFDRAREIEFDRQWNILRPESEDEGEKRSEFYTQLTGEDNSFVRLSAGRLTRNAFVGNRAELVTEIPNRNLPELNTRTSFVESTDSLRQQKGSWFKHRGNSGYSFDLSGTTITPFVNWETEYRLQKTFNDSLTSQSLMFYDINPGLRLNFGSLIMEGGVGYRVNQRPLENQLQKESHSRSQRFRIEYQPNSNFRTVNSAQFRRKTTGQDFLGEALTPESRGVLLRSASNYSLLSDGINGELIYEVNTERRALLQETYIEVGPELGQFTWEDLNGDGVQQVDEFFREVTPNEGTYIRQFVPADELLPVIDVTFRSRNEFQVGQLFGQFAGMQQKALEYLTWNSLFEIRETNREDNLRKVYLLHPSVLRNPENSISGQRIIRQSLDWRTEDRDAELSLAYNQTNSLIQRAVGVQAGVNRLMLAEGEYQVSERVRVLGSYRNLDIENTNSRFTSRSYSIRGFEAEPGIGLFISRSAQIEWRTGYSFKRSQTSRGRATSGVISIKSRAQLYLFNRIQNRLNLELRRTEIDGEVGGQAEFELTDGLGRGTNIVWGLNSDYRATSLLRVSLQYNGRTTSESKIIHTLRLVVSAVF